MKTILKISLIAAAAVSVFLSGCNNDIVEPEDYYYDKMEKCSTAIFSNDRYTEWTVVVTYYKKGEIIKQRQYDAKGSHKGIVGETECNVYYND